MPFRAVVKALMLAVSKGREQSTALLIKAGSSVNASNNLGQTPLIYAGGGGHINCLTILIDKGADVNAAADDGLTPLLAAASAATILGYHECVNILIQAGADVNAIEQAGYTPLMWAAYKGQTPMLTASHPGRSRCEHRGSRWSHGANECLGGRPRGLCEHPPPGRS